MSSKYVNYYRKKLTTIIEKTKEIKNNELNYLNPEKYSLDILEQKIEYKKTVREIAILEHKDQSIIDSLNLEISLYSKKLNSFRQALGFVNLKK